MEYMSQWQGITPAMIKNGISKLKSRYPLKFLPDPVEFVYEFCFPTPEEIGLPTELKAWQEANDHAHEPAQWRWSHRAVYLAARFTGWFELRRQSSPESIRATRKKFNEKYQELVSALAKGKELEPVKSLEYLNDPKARSEQELKTTMEDQGINPGGGRAEFMKRFGGMLSNEQAAVQGGSDEQAV